MKKVLELTLGILTAIGAFVDIGDIVGAAATGARFRMALAWAIVLGTVGIMLYSEMAGRIATLSKRAVFDIARERLGAKLALMNLGASFFVNLLTLAAELGGLALIVELLSNVNYIVWIPPAAVLVWVVVWRMKFQSMERMFGLAGLGLLVWVVALWKFGPDWGSLLHSAGHPAVPSSESHVAYWYWAVSLLGATITVYEPFFFSSGAIEEKWGRTDLIVNRVNVYIGYPLGAILSLSLMALAAVFLAPRGVDVQHLSQSTIPTQLVVGRIGFVFLLVGMFAAVGGAAIQTSLSAGYIVAQYFGWQWGKAVPPREASRFHAVILLSIVAATLLVLSTIDPIKLTEVVIALVAVAAPLTYFPILIIANDPRYVGDKTNTPVSNALAMAFLVVMVAASVAAIPLLIVSKGGA